MILKERKWGEKEKKALLKGIEKYGIGNWNQIREEFLPDWVELS